MDWQRTKRPGIYKRTTPTGTRYRVFVRDAGGKQFTKTFRTWRDAEGFSNMHGVRRSSGELPDRERGKLTLRDLFEAVHEARTYAAATLELHDSVLRRIGPLADRQLREITPDAIDDALESIDRPSMRDKVRRVLAAVFAFAVHKRWLVVSPVRRPNTSRTRADRLQRRRGATPDRKRYLTEDELAALVDEIPERYRALVLLMARMGLRPGEAYALRVGKFTPATQVPKRKPATLTIDTSLSGFTKTGEPRELVLPPVVAEMLAAHLERFADAGDPEAPMFTKDDGRWIATKSSADAWRRRHFTPAAERAGLGAGFTPNGLRHSAAAFAIAHGANVYHVQRMLGHAKPSITLDVYGALWDDSLGELAERLDEAIRGSVATG